MNEPLRKWTKLEAALIAVFRSYGWEISPDGETGDQWADLDDEGTGEQCSLGLTELARNLTAEMEANA